MDASGINLRGMVVVGLGVVTTIVLLAIVPTNDSGGAGGAGVSTPPATTVPTTTSTPGGTTQTTTAAGPTTTTVPAAQRPVLKLGSTGADVTALQQQLTSLGFYDGPADGNFGAATQTAVINFQKAKNLPADGVVGATTWAALYGG